MRHSRAPCSALGTYPTLAHLTLHFGEVLFLDVLVRRLVLAANHVLRGSDVAEVVHHVEASLSSRFCSAGLSHCAI